MGVDGLIVGVLFFILSIFLAQAVPVLFTTVATPSLDIFKVFILGLGAASIFIGARSK